MKDLQSWGSESKKFGIISVDEGQINNKKNTKLRFQVSTLHQSELIIIIIIITIIITVTANRRRKVQQRRSSNKVEPKAY